MAVQTSGATTAFFEGLARRGHEHVLEPVTGSLRFDLTDGPGTTEHWTVELTNGDVAVSQADRPADVTITVARSLFDDIIDGRANATTALLRGELSAGGDLGLFVLFEQLFARPADPGGATPRTKGDGADR